MLAKIFRFSIFLLIAMCWLFSQVTYAATSSQKKLIALTFDDGPSIPYTEQVLALLEAHHAKATFFVMGGNVKLHPEILKKVFAAGNVIGNHTYTHPLITKISDSALEKELTKTNEIIFKTIHVYPVLFRPPYGMSSSRTNEVLKKLGLKKITWDYMVDDYDYKKTTSEIIARSVLQHARPGAIITMHDGGTNRAKTVAALATIIPTLQQQGYELVTVADLLHISPYQNKN
ncbi:MAG: polysaccharide deacetylase family protein [Gammaproteobacteria bacterium]|nr:polysaccharide deacetylase family protein [Gammaproteobacteria bacterium]